MCLVNANANPDRRSTHTYTAVYMIITYIYMYFFTANTFFPERQVGFFPETRERGSIYTYTF